MVGDLLHPPFLMSPLIVWYYKMRNHFRFYPVSFSWVAFNLEPKGIIVFIGGILYGSFPSFFYNYTLKQLFLEGYTIIVLPFRFTWRHWSVALSLLREQQILRNRIPDILKGSGFQYKDYEVYLEDENYIWLGHSLGCKYIALLEFLADWRRNSGETCDLMRKSLVNSQEQIAEIENQIEGINISLKDQCSILMAPEISGTESAIPVPLLPRLIDDLGIGVQPIPEETFNLIENSPLFNLTALISFSEDTIVGTKKDKIIIKNGAIDRRTKTIPWIRKVKPKIEKEDLDLYREIEGQHLRPLGVQLGNKIFGPIAAPPENLVPEILNLLNLLKKK
jgi:Protein of unknown function (DUF1350)